MPYEEGDSTSGPPLRALDIPSSDSEQITDNAQHSKNTDEMMEDVNVQPFDAHSGRDVMSERHEGHRFSRPQRKKIEGEEAIKLGSNLNALGKPLK